MSSSSLSDVCLSASLGTVITCKIQLGENGAREGGKGEGRNRETIEKKEYEKQDMMDME